ncbi:major facilitator superfamily domain-containing protein [Xylariales sp. PMI_506]|nr:major facilitator superfamily domain-containing protein [Xylariales sp. PMI_506]
MELPGYRGKPEGPLRYWKSTSLRWIIPPDGGSTAWLQVLGSFLINFNNWGLANSFGVFQAYFETDLLASHSPSSIVWIGTLQAALILIVGVVSGPIFDMGYFTPVLVISSLLLVFALILLSFATQYYQIMLTWGVLGGLCTGLLYIPSVAVIPLYFTTHRGLALGVATSGASLGGVVYPIVVRRVLSSYESGSQGFAWACRAMALIVLVTLIAANLLIRPTGNQRGKMPIRQLFDKSTLTDVPFVAQMICAFFLYAGFLVPFILTPVFAQEGLDSPVSEDTSFYLLAIPNATQFIGRIATGYIADQYDFIGPELLLGSASFLAAFLCVCWIAVHNLGGFVVYLILYGFVSGAIATLPPAVLGYISPNLATIGTRIGMLYACAGVGALIGAPVALAADSNGGGGNGFQGAQLWTALTMMAGAIAFVITGYEARRRRLIIDGDAKKDGARDHLLAPEADEAGAEGWANVELTETQHASEGGRPRTNSASRLITPVSYQNDSR